MREAQAVAIFCNHFGELAIALFEVELIINNAPLTCVYPSTIETCLTFNHFLFAKQLLYSSNTTSSVATNQQFSRVLLIRYTTSVIIFRIGKDMNM